MGASASCVGLSDYPPGGTVQPHVQLLACLKRTLVYNAVLLGHLDHICVGRNTEITGGLRVERAESETWSM